MIANSFSGIRRRFSKWPTESRDMSFANEIYFAIAGLVQES